MTIEAAPHPSPELGAFGRFRTLFARFSNGSERSLAGRAALAAFSIRVASAAIAYLSQVMLARWMGSAEYGVFVFAWVLVLILGGLSTLGFGVSLIRFIPEYRVAGDFAHLRGILRASRLLTVAVSTTVAGLGILSLYLFADRLDGHYVLPLALAFVCLPLYTLTDVHDGVGRAQTWINLALVPPYVLRPLGILVVMAIARFAGLPMDATTAAGSAIIATWAAGIGQLVFMERRLDQVIPSAKPAYRLGDWLYTGWPIFLIYGFELLLQNTDVLVISHFTNPSEAGIYFAALKTISLIAFVHYAVGTAVGSRLSALNTTGDKTALAAMIRDAAAWTFWPSLFGAICLLLLGKYFLLLFGEEFVTGYPVMFVLVIGLLVRSAVGPAEFVFRMLGAERWCMLILGASAIINIAANLILVPRLGIMGAAAATALAAVFSALSFAVVAKTRLGLDIGIWAAVFGRKS